MSAATEQLRIATSSGPVWLGLVTHFGVGLLALVSGFIALAVVKGSRAHRRTGMVFVVSMIALGLTAAGLAVYEGKTGSVIGGIFTAYLVFTGFTTVRPIAEPHGRKWHLALMVLGFSLALIQLAGAWSRLSRPPGMKNGPPAGMLFFLATVALLAPVGDWRVWRAGGIRGARRLARHLWRMCFALFIASGSFLLGQMKFLPEALRIVPLMAGLAVAPLVVLLYWMWRVRLRQRLQGMQLRQRVEAGEIA